VALLHAACAANPVPPGEDAMLWSAQDVSVMVQVEDLEQFLNAPVSDAHTATWEKQRTSDGALRLDYDYFSLPQRMGVSWQVTFHQSVAAARLAMAEAVAGLMRDSQDAEMEIETAEGFYEWGDESVFAVLKTAGEPGGEFFFARYGATTVSLSLAGVYFFEGAEFHRLVGPALSNLLFYHPASFDE
jgi:hypothetical protein